MGTCGDYAILGCDGNGSFRALCFSSVDLFPMGSRIAASFDSEHETINGNREDAENDSVGRGILSDFGGVAWGRLPEISYSGRDTSKSILGGL